MVRVAVLHVPSPKLSTVTVGMDSMSDCAGEVPRCAECTAISCGADLVAILSCESLAESWPRAPALFLAGSRMGYADGV